MAETLVLTSSGGQSYDLTGLVNFTALRGMSGYGAPPAFLVEDTAPGLDGSFIADITLNPRSLRIPIMYQAATRQAFLDLRRQLVSDFNPKMGAGYLIFTDGTGHARRLNEVYVVGGLGGDNSQGANGVGWEKAMLDLRALDPYFYNQTATNVVFSKTSASGTFLGNPFLPITLTDSALFGSKTVNNPGDAEVYPIWEITGAFTKFSLINETTGRTLTFEYTIPNGNIITIDCRSRRSQTPNGKKVMYAGVDMFEYLTAWDFWPLEPGNNTVRIEAENTDSGTAFEFDYYPVYIGM